MEQEVFVHAYETVRPIVLKAFRQYFIGSIISVVGKTTVEIIELFECRQKVP